MRVLLIGLCALLLCGCTRFNADMARKQQLAQQQVIANDDAICRSYGALPGSQPYIGCRMQLQQQHANAEAQDKAAYQQWWEKTFNKPPPQPAPCTHFTTTYVGNTAQTHCY